MKKMMHVCGILLLLLSCSNDDAGDVQMPSNILNVEGTKYLLSNTSFSSTYSSFVNTLNDNNAISIIAQVDHEANAISVGRSLNPTKTVFFGNPILGTPLMQKNQLAGLDLPQKMAFFQTKDNQVYTIYNSVAYLESRYGLEGVETLGQISNALKNLSEEATGSSVQEAANLKVEQNEGIINKQSVQDFETTYTALENAIVANTNLQIIATLNHQANAASVGLELRPTKLIIFGNPALGTPLLQNQQSTALDLPQKMLVWEDEQGSVYISYNNPAYLMKRHNITDNEEVISTLSTVLNNLSEAAAGN